ncbi:hypothetical protein RFI_09747 [Reticulomyxa filosa]|uniref:Uncharacterized protein n=1 Tax=Reticulomyxa filosa TaxID=46433 RepID=X6NMC4_RETFI|nr:hypothetical protein RFI_09747 [Reticulomyxa filosa]|eukprot:ETO27385.1 hypothetical protein RFI_09747 [Reticulomyxa filosa]
MTTTLGNDRNETTLVGNALRWNQNARVVFSVCQRAHIPLIPVQVPNDVLERTATATSTTFHRQTEHESEHNDTKQKQEEDRNDTLIRLCKQYHMSTNLVQWTGYSEDQTRFMVDLVQCLQKRTRYIPLSTIQAWRRCGEHYLHTITIPAVTFGITGFISWKLLLATLAKSSSPVQQTPHFYKRVANATTSLKAKTMPKKKDPVASNHVPWMLWFVVFGVSTAAAYASYRRYVLMFFCFEEIYVCIKTKKQAENKKSRPTIDSSSIESENMTASSSGFRVPVRSIVFDGSFMTTSQAENEKKSDEKEFE